MIELTSHECGLFKEKMEINGVISFKVKAQIDTHYYDEYSEDISMISCFTKIETKTLYEIFKKHGAVFKIMNIIHHFKNEKDIDNVLDEINSLIVLKKLGE